MVNKQLVCKLISIGHQELHNKKKNCHFDYSCLLSSYTLMMNTLHTRTNLDGLSLWRELVKNAENTLEQVLCAFSDMRTNSLQIALKYFDQLPPQQFALMCFLNSWPTPPTKLLSCCVNIRNVFIISNPITNICSHNDNSYFTVNSFSAMDVMEMLETKH